MVASFLSAKADRNPPKRPVISATIGRTIAKGNPSNEYVTKILSTPVCGVEIKNDNDAPFEAPLRYKETPVGITPQEHKGNGIPKIEAFKTELKLILPKYFVIPALLKKACNIPAKRKPNNKYGAISLVRFQNSVKYASINFILIKQIKVVLSF